jgi:hypothetical protein
LECQRFEREIQAAQRVSALDGKIALLLVEYARELIEELTQRPTAEGRCRQQKYLASLEAFMQQVDAHRAHQAGLAAQSLAVVDRRQGLSWQPGLEDRV